MKAPFALLILLLPVSCTTQTRAPSSAVDAQAEVEQIQQSDIEASKQISALFRIENYLTSAQKVEPARGQAGLEKDRSDAQAALTKTYFEKTKALQNLASTLKEKPWSGAGPWFETAVQVEGISRQESFILRSPDPFRIGQVGAPAFALDHRSGASTYKLRLENQAPLPSPVHDEIIKPLKAEMECDAVFSHPAGSVLTPSRESSTRYVFDWYYNEGNGQSVLLEFAPQVQRCILKFKEASDKDWTHQVFFAASEILIPNWRHLALGTEVCARPLSLMNATGPTRFFWQQNFQTSTCPRVVDEVQTLADPAESLNQKIKSLTGADLPPEILRHNNPMIPLDFSRAPQLDVIWVSGLNFMADLHGAVLAQALQYHADRGAQIRILVPKITTRGHDEMLLRKLQTGHPNVKIQLYSYHRSDGFSGGYFDQIHRVNHIKMLLGYSEKNPGNSFVITGGRNIGDIYLLKSAPDYSSYPELRKYGKGQYVYYEDFDVKFKGVGMAKSVLAQLISFWNRDSETQVFRPTTMNADYKTTPDLSARFEALSKSQIFLRHVISIPYADGGQLEKMYVQAIDSAEKEILIASPFFIPPQAISEALHRAHLRGVKVQVITGLPFENHESNPVVEEANKVGINRHVADLNIYRWKEAGTVLHAKVFVIDEKLSFVSSVNLNARSFTHDTESGVLILHEATAGKIKSEFEVFLKHSELMTAPMKLKWIDQILLKFGKSYL